MSINSIALLKLPRPPQILDFKFLEQNLLWGGQRLLQLFLQIKALKSYSYTYRLHLPSTGACAEESFGGVDRLVSGIHRPVEEKWLLLLCLLLHECCRFLQKDRFHFFLIAQCSPDKRLPLCKNKRATTTTTKQQPQKTTHTQPFLKLFQSHNYIHVSEPLIKRLD